MKVFILLFIATNVECLHLQLFNDTDYKMFKREFKLSVEEEKKCFNVQSSDNSNFNRETALSIKTDQCVILYDSHTCGGFLSWHWRIDKDTPTVDKDSTYSYNDFSGYQIGSFHVCDQELGGGGDLLDVDFFTGKDGFGFKKVEYKKICGCQNIPYEMTLEEPYIRSLNNHGNGIALFEKEHCEPPYLYVPPGTNKISNSLSNASDTSLVVPLKLRSFLPMRTVKCQRLDASVTKFDFKNDSTLDHLLEFENVAMSLESVFRNNGSAKITQDYTATQRVKEGVEITKATGWSTVHSVGLSSSVETDVSCGVPLLASGKITVKLGGNYQWTDSHSGSDTDKKTVEKEETFSIRQAIEIPPCTEYRVNSFIKMVKNYTVEYTAFARLTGKAGDTVMSKNELKANIGQGMNFIRDIDDHTIEVSVKGVMFAKYGIKTLIVGEGHPIEGCLKNTNAYITNRVPPFVLEFPIHKE